MTELEELVKINKKLRWIIKHLMIKRDGADFALAKVTSETK